jgi:hypothetical protein
MPSRQGHTAPSPTLGAVLHRIALRALAQASLVLVACMMVGVLNDQGVEPYLRSAVLAYSLFGSFALGQGSGEEIGARPGRPSLCPLPCEPFCRLRIDHGASLVGSPGRLLIH